MCKNGKPPGWNLQSAWDALRIDRFARNNIEAYNSLAVAQKIAERLPRTPKGAARLIEEGQRVARGMSWDVVARDYLLPALARC